MNELLISPWGCRALCYYFVVNLKQSKTIGVLRFFYLSPILIGLPLSLLVNKYFGVVTGVLLSISLPVGGIIELILRYYFIRKANVTQTEHGAGSYHITYRITQVIIAIIILSILAFSFGGLALLLYGAAVA